MFQHVLDLISLPFMSESITQQKKVSKLAGIMIVPFRAARWCGYIQNWFVLHPLPDCVFYPIYCRRINCWTASYENKRTPKYADIHLDWPYISIILHSWLCFLILCKAITNSSSRSLRSLGRA